MLTILENIHCLMILLIVSPFIWVVLLKSYFEKLIDNPVVPLFPHYEMVWNAHLPVKVKVFAWILAYKKLNTDNMIQ